MIGSVTTFADKVPNFDSSTTFFVGYRVLFSPLLDILDGFFESNETGFLTSSLPKISLESMILTLGVVSASFNREATRTASLVDYIDYFFFSASILSRFY